jgi:hypothetical protein
MSRHREWSRIAFLDLILNALLVFIALFIVAFLQINEKTEDKEKKSVDTDGAYIIIVTWEDKSGDDVDVYVRDPAGDIVFFQDKESGLMHLERDDLGVRNDQIIKDGQIITVQKNEERVILRGVITGEYIVNIHMYLKDNPYIAKVKVRLIKIKGGARDIIGRELELSYKGDEKTAFRFTVNVEGEVTNINYLPKSLVSSIRRP